MNNYTKLITAHGIICSVAAIIIPKNKLTPINDTQI